MASWWDRLTAAKQPFPALRTIGLSVNSSKCALWGPGATIDEETGIPITHYDEGSGLKVLGIPIGRPGELGFQDTLLQKKIASLEKACEELAGIPDPRYNIAC